MSSTVIIKVGNSENTIDQLNDFLLKVSRKISECVFISVDSLDIQVFKNKFDELELKAHLCNSEEDIDKAILKSILKSKSDFIFLHDSDDIWEEGKAELFLEELNNGFDFVFSDASVSQSNNTQPFLEIIGISTKQKLKLIEYKSDEILFVKNIATNSTIAFRKTELLNKLKIKKENELMLAHVLASIYAAYDASKVQFIPKQLSRTSSYTSDIIRKQNAISDSSIEFFQSKQRQLESILEVVDNAHFRRAHYFWFMRERSKSLPFLQKLISLNTFCLLYTSPSPRDRTRSRMPSSA